MAQQMQYYAAQQQLQQVQQPQAPAQMNPESDLLRNLMVNYIPTTVDEVQLRQLFDRFGPIESVKIVCDRETHQSRGYGFVKFQSAASAQQAISGLNGFSILNKRLKVALAASGHQRAGPVSDGGYFGGYGSYGAYPSAANPYAQQQMMAMYQPYMMQPQQQQQQQQLQPLPPSPQQQPQSQQPQQQQQQQPQQQQQQQPQGSRPARK
ncbi:RNA-binding protein UBP-2 [Trypanosoma grayi]|uniref:RNA-binding protein UBP-2 n=1 Tax=Trypanosoma grayi TaxID=71804 RepID=UPI0004F4A116|nr:RNA-binding protein UBP-2 [Trypanosoma grayi]KEG09244.1 RNA-binding protein UBP-2 [Trypanosoma grayi]